jgi:hypothetical protein
MNKKVFKKISIVALFTITFVMTVFPPAWEYYRSGSIHAGPGKDYGIKCLNS